MLWFFGFLFLMLCVFPLIQWVGGMITQRVEMRGEIEHRRLEVIERAVGDPSVDPQRRDELLRSLTHASAPVPASTTIGWVSFCAGAALGAIGLTGGVYELLSVGIVVVAVGFALLSLPLVARELATREQSPSASSRNQP